MSTLKVLLIIACFGYAFAKNIQHHKISMVSTSDSNKAAIFTHAESPVWDDHSQSLYFVDALQQNVHRLDYFTGKIYTKHIGYGQVNVISLVEGSNRLLVAVRAALHFLDWNVAGDAALRLLTTFDEGLPDNLINEGKADSNGRFWAGTKGPQSGDDVLPDKATFYSISQQTFKNPQIQLRPVSISNGLTWSLNNSVMYYIDSPTQKIEAFDFDPINGEISGRRTVIDISEYGYEDAIPDGMTIDSRGHLWVAIMFGGSVLHIDPDSRTIVYAYKLPVTRVTSVCWGGPNLDELFVTTSKSHSKEPLSGAIFTIRETGSYGVPMYRFRFDNANDY
ncbi:regucalcin-like [Melitaea cinxia]|uniref:regucalcin-like n=1 Tax=Melitaea cinxia TaxID=113334 RepID=UPI001E26FC24|nr:regucalcin-like [Melitaea cinxia]